MQNCADTPGLLSQNVLYNKVPKWSECTAQFEKNWTTDSFGDPFLFRTLYSLVLCFFTGTSLWLLQGRLIFPGTVVP